MSAQSSSLLGYGLYFIDVLACLLFCVTLALVGARFGQEHTVELALPELERSAGTGSDLTGTTIALRTEGDEFELTLDGEASQDRRSSMAPLSVPTAPALDRASAHRMNRRSHDSSSTRKRPLVFRRKKSRRPIDVELIRPASPGSARRPRA